MKQEKPFRFLQFSGLVLVCFCFKSFLYAQQVSSFVHYFDENMRATTLEKAYYYVKTEKDTGNLFKASTYTVVNDRLVSIIDFIDSTLVSKHGPYTFYDEEGNMEASGWHYYNFKDGLCREWDGEGYITDSILYEMGGFNGIIPLVIIPVTKSAVQH